MFWAVISGFALALAAPAIHRLFGKGSGWFLGAVPALLFAYFCSLWGSVSVAGALRESWPWIPSLGVALSFRADGLSLLFALLISGIGFLVMVYSGGYLHGHPALGRWYACLSMFMASMLGVVLADNLIVLFCFWELTSFSSYLLIGFYHEREEARHAALQALLVTGLGGLAMLAGFILLGQAGGSTELSVLVNRAEAIRGHALCVPAALLVLLGAMTKSAQFPFHFWLPNAMAAPAPASAYLHSSTMVKAGIYLMARFHPVFGGVVVWDRFLVFIGAVTFLSGAAMAIQQNAIKRLLAYSTVSALGGMTMLLGLGHATAVDAAMAFLFAHALYKAALFLVAGAIEHETGERDVRRLGGLGRLMPRTAAGGALAAFSMAGVPLFAGFSAKELFFEGLLDGRGWLTIILVAVTVVSSSFFVAVAVATVWKPFGGSRVLSHREPHEPPVAMWMGPVILGVLCLLCGVRPDWVGQALIRGASAAILSGESALHLAAWPALHAALGLSVTAWVGGLAVYLARERFQRAAAGLAPLAHAGPEQWYERGLRGMLYGARLQTRFFQNGYLRIYLLIIVLALLCVSGAALIPQRASILDVLSRHVSIGLGGVHLFESGLALVMIAGIGAVVHSRTKLAAAASLGVVGYSIALVFVFYGAPDLAMTQFVIETLTVILFVLVFYHLPPMTLRRSRVAAARDLAVSLAMGVLMAVLTVIAVDAPVDHGISAYFQEHSYSAAHGRNIVNVILVDFRGIDTLGEITVLAIAGVGAHSLLKLRLGRRNPQ